MEKDIHIGIYIGFEKSFLEIGTRASKLGAPAGARSRHVVNQFVCVVGNVLLYIHFKTR